MALIVCAILFSVLGSASNTETALKVAAVWLLIGIALLIAGVSFGGWAIGIAVVCFIAGLC